MKEQLSTDYEGRCGNCHSVMNPDDKYCRYCGTAKGKGKFLPYENEMYCVYGPPIKEVFKCQTCGYSWVTTGLGGDNSKYCPQCCSKQLDVESSEEMTFSEYFKEERTMIEIIDSLKTEFSGIIIDDKDKNGKTYDRTRWIYPVNVNRNSNVFLEVWEHPKADRYDLVMPLELMTPEEKKSAEDVNSRRGTLRLYHKTDAEILEFVRGKIKIYLNQA